jgi:glycosyltransferase involved in cell wall biosynthesis
LLRYIKFDESKIRVIPCCISDDFKPAPKAFNSSRPTFLQIGTGSNKNLLKVAEALTGIPCRLRIIGKLSEEHIAKLEACNIDYTNAFNLSDADITGEFAQCDALIFVSTYEGFGLPIVEANATGRPVITGNILSMPEVAGNAACLVDPFDVNEIRNGILRVMADEDYRNTLVANGFVNAQRFRPDRIAPQYLELYKEIMLMKNARK